MVRTRSMARHEAEPQLEQQKKLSTEECKSVVSAALPTPQNVIFKTPAVTPSVKSEAAPRSKGRTQASSSTKARKAHLTLIAAKQKAQIQMELIDRQLEADLADLEEESKDNYSPHEDRTQEVEKWLEHSHHERMQSAPEYGNPSGILYPPDAVTTSVAPEVSPMQAISLPQPPPTTLHLPMESQPHMPHASPPPADASGINATIQMLASALKDLASTSAPNTNLMSRLCTPKDLPDFHGEPLEWLQFKQAYNESTELCKFTPEENLWRLRKCLRGAAKDAVAALLITASPPCKIMSTLELRFGNPDHIISKILQDMKKLNPMPQDYHKDIVQFSVKVQNLIEAVRAVKREEYLQGTSIVNIILSKLPTILLSKWSDYSFPLITEGNKSRMVILSDFLHNEAVKISTTSHMYFTSQRNDQQKYNKTYDSTTNRTQTILVNSEQEENKCLYCRASKHKLTDCKQFKKALRKTRWEFVKRNGICFKCLISRHKRETCSAPVCDKNSCGQAHHSLLHYDVNKLEPAAASRPCQQNPVSPTPQTSAPTTTPSASISETVTHINNASDCKVLLKVVAIRIHSNNGVINTSALIDDGSTVSMISSGLAKRAGLVGRSETMCIRGAWSDNELVCETMVANMNLSGMNNKVHNIKVRCVDKLNLPVQQFSMVDCKNYSHLISLESYLCTNDVKPEILIGQDNYHLLLPLEVRLGKRNEPSATLTPLGWCIHGMFQPPRTGYAWSAGAFQATLFLNSCDASAPSTATSHDARDEQLLLRELHEEVRRSFAIDSLGVAGKPRQNINDLHAVAQLENSAELIDGRWRVGLPWKDATCSLPDSYPNALQRLKGIERKMGRDHIFADRYKERINHLLKNDYAKKLENITPITKTWYLPHFGVDNPNKKNLRLVFDAADSVSCKSLNDYFLTGPDLLSSLFGIMLRFRENVIAVTGDIKDMFLRVKIRPEDQHALRFLWRENSNEPVSTYVSTSLVFGLNCAPFTALFIKNMNARRFESTLPAAVEAVYKSHYMDDYIDSLPDEATAIEMVRNVTDIHKSGGFHIRNWTSNSGAVLDSVPKETLGPAAVNFKVDQQYQGERTLGLMWNPSEDELGFDLSLKRIPQNVIQNRPTKRIILRVVMSIFDVFGFLAPFTIQGKIMLQETWRLKVGWDDAIPDDIYTKWCKWVELLKDLSRIRIPRCYHTQINTTNVVCQNNGNQKPIGKCEVSLGLPPLAPRATHAAAAPASSDDSASVICNEGRSLPTVSATVLPSASSTNNNYTSLELHTLCDASLKAMCTTSFWRWKANGKVRVAFIASKCRVIPVKPITIPRAELQAAVMAARLADTIIKEHRMVPKRRYFWCDSTTVLQWIRNNTRKYKTFEANRLGEIDELTRVSEWRYIKSELNVADIGTREEFDYTIFQKRWFKGPDFLYSDESSWPEDIVQGKNTNVECIAMVQESATDLPVPDPQRFSCWLRLKRTMAVVLKFIDKCKGLTGEVDCGSMAQAEVLLLRKAQLDSFAVEISAIKKGKQISQDSKLRTLSPYLDETTGLLRLGGRIDAASDVDLEVKRPIILDGKHLITRLVVRHSHLTAAHGNQETVINNLKQKYWIIRIRPTVKTVVSSCMLCRIRKCKPQVPRMGDLPHARVAHHQRPFTFCGLDLFGPMEVTVGRGRQKRYGVLFTCLTVRSIHLEIVASLTTDSLIMALRRMAARRGWPSNLYSDNGTNLRGAEKELKQSIQGLDRDALKAIGVNNDMQWIFVPPKSPHWAGAWERLIRSVKSSLRVILHERAPREEVLVTLMAEVENMVNSRPLSHVSVDPESLESLTPNHFLLGSSSNMPIIGNFNVSDLNLRKQWRKSQILADMFWRRWVKEVLPDLLPRKKWTKEVKPLQVGDLVLVVDPDSPRNTWPKGVIQQLHPGKDGRVRLVEVKTKTGVWKRPAARVARIPLDDEC